QPLHRLFEQQVERTPDAVAIVFDDAALTYAELNLRANRLAHHLVALGVGPDSLVGVAMERSLDMSVALLAILKAGGAYVPVDPEYPAERVRFMIDHAQLRWLLTQQ
ncbi:AMP-binding protein, partial [Burkholderia contaminans]